MASAVRLEDLFVPAGFPFRARKTTAHIAAARFYQRALRQNHARPSLVERISRAPSPFAVQGLVDDFERFIARGVSPKKRAQVHEVARVRVAVLAGEIP